MWVFEGARDSSKHRTRQAVWADVKRAAKALRIDYVAGTHSARKAYAVELYHRQGGGSTGLAAVQRDLQHEYSSTTLLYIFSSLA